MIGRRARRVAGAAGRLSLVQVRFRLLHVIVGELANGPGRCALALRRLFLPLRPRPVGPWRGLQCQFASLAERDIQYLPGVISFWDLAPGTR